MSPLTTVDWRRENVWLRMALIAPSGAGKTRGALEVATKMFGGTLPVVGIDTEHGRMKLYADRYRLAAYSQLNDDHSPKAWEDAIRWAYAQAPGGVVVLDSFSHEWMGKGGVLQMVDRFGDWKNVRPQHSDLIDAMMSVPMHVIVCIRAKMKYGVEEVEEGSRTRQVISKLGIGPVQDDAIIYEFDVVGNIDAQTHECAFTNRCDPLVDSVRSLVPGDEVAGILTSWLSEGDPPPLPEAATDEAVAELVASLTEEGFSEKVIEQKFAERRAGNFGMLSPEYVAERLAESHERLAAKKAKAKEPAAS
jgi:hypothetical protein